VKTVPDEIFGIMKDFIEASKILLQFSFKNSFRENIPLIPFSIRSKKDTVKIAKNGRNLPCNFITFATLLEARNNPGDTKVIDSLQK
jgi:hypothetical protein